MRIPMLIVENDVAVPDSLVWRMQTLLADTDDTWERGPFTLDASFFTEAPGFWNEDMPDAAFRIDGTANGTWIYRPCGTDAPTSCNATCVWRDVVRYENNRPTIFIAHDDPCFLEYPPPSDTMEVDLYAIVSTDSTALQAVWIKMERGIKWSWMPWLNVELQAPPGAWATGYYARPMVDSGSLVTSLDVRAYVGLANGYGLDVFNSSLQYGEINPPGIFLVLPPESVAWGEGELVDDCPYVLTPGAPSASNVSCTSQAPYLHGSVYPSASFSNVSCEHGGECSDWLWLDEHFADGTGCVCPFAYGGNFCEQHVYEEVTNATEWNVGIYNVTLRTELQHGGSSLRWSELLVWDMDECAVDNGGCGVPRNNWCENRCGHPAACHPTEDIWWAGWTV
jgi:hypothetical protein